MRSLLLYFGSRSTTAGLRWGNRANPSQYTSRLLLLVPCAVPFTPRKLYGLRLAAIDAGCVWPGRKTTVCRSAVRERTNAYDQIGEAGV